MADISEDAQRGGYVIDKRNWNLKRTKTTIDDGDEDVEEEGENNVEEVMGNTEKRK